jgi:integrase
MARTALMGAHSHHTANGVAVHIWQREGKYLARGRIQGSAFGETLGADVAKATTRLRRILNEIEDGTYIRPTESRKMPLPRGQVPQLTLRQLISDFLLEKRRTLGQNSADDYTNRLMPPLIFAEQATARQKWPLAININHDFAIALRCYLHDGYRTTRNGRPGGKLKSPSPTQIFNILDCLRTMFYWARRPDIHKLPVDWANPLTAEIVGKRPKKDPKRKNNITLDHRIRLVNAMDQWQLCQLVLSLVLPMRPEEVAGLLVSDVNWAEGWLEFGTRLGGRDFNKGRQDFVVPFPDECRPLLRACIDGQSAGPLLRSRKAFGRQPKNAVNSQDELIAVYEDRLAKAPAGTRLTEQDDKVIFRRLLVSLGGVSTDELAREFKALCSLIDPDWKVKYYDLRHVVSTDLARTPGMTHVDWQYFTGHSTTDIDAYYVTVDPVRAMNLYFATIRPLLDAISQRTQELSVEAAAGNAL